MAEAAVLPSSSIPVSPGEQHTPTSEKMEQKIPKQVAIIRDGQGNAIAPDFYATDDRPGFSIASQDQNGGISAIQEKRFNQLHGDNLAIRWNDRNRPGIKLGDIQLEKYGDSVVVYGRGNRQHLGEVSVTVIDAYTHAQQLENERAQAAGEPPRVLDRTSYAEDQPLVMVRQSVQPRGESSPLTVARIFKLHSIPEGIPTAQVQSVVQEASREVEEQNRAHPESPPRTPERGLKNVVKETVDNIRKKKGLHLNLGQKVRVVIGGIGLLASRALPIAPVPDAIPYKHPEIPFHAAGASGDFANLPEDPRSIPAVGEDNRQDPETIHDALTDTVPFESPDGTYWRGPAGQRMLEAYNKLYGTTYTDVEQIPQPFRNALEHVNIDVSETADPQINVGHVPKGKKITIYSEVTDEQLIKLLAKAGETGNAELNTIKEELVHIGAGVPQNDITNKINHAARDGGLKTV